MIPEILFISELSIINNDYGNKIEPDGHLTSWDAFVGILGIAGGLLVGLIVSQIAASKEGLPLTFIVNTIPV